MNYLKSCLVKYGIGTFLLLVGSIANALNTEITLQADSEISPTSSELVTFGLPLAKGEMTDVSELKVMLGGEEIAAFVEPGLRYHWADNSIRSVTIQIQNIDMTRGNVTLTVSDEGMGLQRLSEQPHKNGWVQAGANKDNIFYPRIFALHDTQYLANSELIPPYTPSSGSDKFELFQDVQFDTWAGGLDFQASDRANWLFDRSSAMFKYYMTTGRVEALKEAFLSKQFYFKYIKNDGTAQSPSDGDGCFTYQSTSCSDVKYIYAQPAKLGWALLGDQSQWDVELINEMAIRGDMGWWQPPTRGDITEENFNFTERAAGIAGLLEVNSWEITANTTTLSNMNERIDYLKKIQQTEFSWDISNGWVPKSGGFTHNYLVHDGAESISTAPIGDTNSRAFSPWMSENAADFLWQAYWVTKRDDIPGILTKLANAVDLYGFTTAYNASTSSYDKKSAFSGMNPRALTCNPSREDADVLYFASAYASNDSLGVAKDNWYPWYTSQHAIEMVLIMAAGYYFETDETVKTRLLTRAQRMADWGNVDCGLRGITKRMWNWQHRGNSVRTLGWVADIKPVEKSLPASPPSFSAALIDPSLPVEDPSLPVEDPSLPVEDPSLPVEDPSLPVEDPSLSEGKNINSSYGDVPVYVASTECSVNDDPHWQCGGHWVTYSSVKVNDMVAICPAGAANLYADCEKSDSWVMYSNIKDTDALFVCGKDTYIGETRGSCGSSVIWRLEGDLSDVTSKAGL
jgi:hypothetical protein